MTANLYAPQRIRGGPRGHSGHRDKEEGMLAADAQYGSVSKYAIAAPSRPQQRAREDVVLTAKYEADVERIIAGVRKVREQAAPPDVPAPMPICKKCAYQELCWG